MHPKKIRNMSRTKILVLTALMTACICVAAPFSVPIGPVPISLATFVLMISVYVLGAKMSLVSCVLYLLLGLVGLPVFSGFSAGAAKLAGPTGGYLIGYIFLILISGIFAEKSGFKAVWCVLGFVIGTAVLYAVGTAWLKISTGTTVKAALLSGTVLFLPGDAVKIAAAVIIGSRLRRAIRKNG